MLTRCCKISKKTQLSGHLPSGKSDLLHIRCTRVWPEKKFRTFTFLLHFWALCNECSRNHAKKFHAQKYFFCAPKFRLFQTFSDMSSTCQMWVLMLLNFEKSGLQTVPTKLQNIQKGIARWHGTKETSYLEFAFGVNWSGSRSFDQNWKWFTVILMYEKRCQGRTFAKDIC